MAHERPHDLPPGKPGGMAAEVFQRKVRKMLAVEDALRSAEGIEDSACWLDEDARVCGSARLPDRANHADLDDVLAENGLALDAPPHQPTAADGGELTDPAVNVRFSEVDQ